MGEYDFSDFDPGRFQQLVQELALNVLGRGVTVHGPGRDGGRDFSWQGKIPYPNGVDPWDGYGVGQVKFKAKNEGSKLDGSWAIEQARDDLKKKSLDPWPEYYLFCTNVALTPVPKTGSQDKLNAVLGEAGFRAFDVWDYHKLLCLI